MPLYKLIVPAVFALFSDCWIPNDPMIGDGCPEGNTNQCCTEDGCNGGEPCFIGGSTDAEGQCTYSSPGMMGECACVPVPAGGGIDPPIKEYYSSAYQADPHLSADLHKIRALHQGACLMDWPRGCTEWGLALAMGPTPLLPEAVTAMDRACELQEPTGCFYLGAAYANGIGVQQDQGIADMLMAWACANGETYGCDPDSFYEDLAPYISE